MIKKNLPLILMFISATTGLITPTSIQALKTELVTEKLLFTEEEKSLVAQNIQIPNFQIQFKKPTLFNSSGVARIRDHSYYSDPLQFSLRNSIYNPEFDGRDVLKITVEGGLDHVVQIFTDSESRRLLKTDQIDSPITQSKTPEVIMITDYINPFLALVYLLVAFYYFKLWLTSMLEDTNINTSKEKILTWVILIAILLG